MNPIRVIEERENLKDWQLADILNVSKSAISKYKNNKRKIGYKPLSGIAREFPEYMPECWIYLRG